MKRGLYLLSIFSILSAIVLIGVLTFWAVYPYRTMVVNNDPIQVLTPRVGKGKPLIYRLNYCKYTDKQANIQKSYVNDITFPASLTIASNLKGCREANVSQIIPYELPSGEYRLKIVFIYQVNPIRTISVVAYTEKFLLIERD